MYTHFYVVVIVSVRVDGVVGFGMFGIAVCHLHCYGYSTVYFLSFSNLTQCDCITFYHQLELLRYLNIFCMY